jgi:hypothetical protein
MPQQANMIILARAAHRWAHGGRPECLDHVDAILNVTDVVWSEIEDDMPNDHYCLQLPVKEGKRD